VLCEPGLAQRLGRCAAERSAGWAWPTLARRVADVYAAVTGVAAAGR
jgi:hypothetical protein